MKIDLAREFSTVPSGRYYSDGPDSGERFREEYLRPAISEPGPIEIRIDGTAGFGSSFLEEAFGGAVRLGYIDAATFLSRLKLVYDDEEFAMYEDLIKLFINDARSENL
ncbi:STAS-like domain-containing protein [Dokdonella immobilis]|uniref:STAS-like domain-containing protein n=1 Tax=Dokdonella immobilis TaxID=578942 RepID=UPI000B8A010D|nr:STAS-like domain-containing protein [Dokdonella immobilis]